MTRPTTAQLNAAYDQLNFWYDKAKKLDEELAKAEKRIAELEEAEQKTCAANVTLDARADLAERQLAAMDSEPVADDGIYRPGDAVGVFNVGCETCPDHLVAWTVKGQNLPAGNYWLYISQQPAPVVPDALIKAVDFYEQVKRENPPIETGAWKDAVDWVLKEACRAAMLQSGNSPVIPDGSEQRIAEAVELLKNAAPAMLADDSGPNGPLVGRLKAQAVPGWIPVSERMPEMGEQQCYVLAADFKNHYWPNIPNIQVGVYGDWFDDGNPTWDDGDGEDLHLKEVTHWMVLPNPPQEAQDDINALIPLVSRNEREVK